MSLATYTQAQQKLLARFGIMPEPLVDVPAVDTRAHVLITGEGPPVMLVIGGGVPTAIWAPLIAELTGFTIYAVDPPGMGLSTRGQTSPSTSCSRERAGNGGRQAEGAS